MKTFVALVLTAMLGGIVGCGGMREHHSDPRKLVTLPDGSSLYTYSAEVTNPGGQDHQLTGTWRTFPGQKSELVAGTTSTDSGLGKYIAQPAGSIGAAIAGGLTHKPDRTNIGIDAAGYGGGARTGPIIASPVANPVQNQSQQQGQGQNQTQQESQSQNQQLQPERGHR